MEFQEAFHFPMCNHGYLSKSENKICLHNSQYQGCSRKKKQTTTQFEMQKEKKSKEKKNSMQMKIWKQIQTEPEQIKVQIQKQKLEAKQVTDQTNRIKAADL